MTELQIKLFERARKDLSFGCIVKCRNEHSIPEYWNFIKQTFPKNWLSKFYYKIDWDSTTYYSSIFQVLWYALTRWDIDRYALTYLDWYLWFATDYQEMKDYITEKNPEILRQTHLERPEEFNKIVLEFLTNLHLKEVFKDDSNTILLSKSSS